MARATYSIIKPKPSVQSSPPEILPRINRKEEPYRQNLAKNKGCSDRVADIMVSPNHSVVVAQHPRRLSVGRRFFIIVTPSATSSFDRSGSYRYDGWHTRDDLEAKLAAQRGGRSSSTLVVASHRRGPRLAGRELTSAPPGDLHPILIESLPQVPTLVGYSSPSPRELEAE